MAKDDEKISLIKRFLEKEGIIQKEEPGIRFLPQRKVDLVSVLDIQREKMERKQKIDKEKVERIEKEKKKDREETS